MYGIMKVCELEGEANLGNWKNDKDKEKRIMNQYCILVCKFVSHKHVCCQF